MQFSKNWLRDYIDIDLSTDICYQLTMAGIEVDSYENTKSKITGDDSIIKLDITPNRGDCFSVLGVAELAAINNVKLKVPKIQISNQLLKIVFLSYVQKVNLLRKSRQEL